MKLGPVTKLDKRNTVNLKKIDDDVMPANDVIVKFSTYDRFGDIWKLDYRRMVCKTISSNL